MTLLGGHEFVFLIAGEQLMRAPGFVNGKCEVLGSICSSTCRSSESPPSCPAGAQKVGLCLDVALYHLGLDVLLGFQEQVCGRGQREHSYPHL